MIRTTRRTALRLEVLEGKQLMAGVFYHLPIHYTNVPGPHHQGGNGNPAAYYYKLFEVQQHHHNHTAGTGILYKPLDPFNTLPTNPTIVYAVGTAATGTNPGKPPASNVSLFDRPVGDPIAYTPPNTGNTNTTPPSFDRPVGDPIAYTPPNQTSASGGPSQTPPTPPSFDRPVGDPIATKPAPGANGQTSGNPSGMGGSSSNPVSYDSPFPHFPYR